ncbi:MAG: spermidine/putrescine ABC transporter substrate-binding protein [Akkermansiaceae bacterium]|nr:spermidine/putrescine ABC transporter substrate-binding protein [Akkermansiaceae bacterium]
MKAVAIMKIFRITLPRLVLAAALLGAGALTSCGPEKEVLHVFTWDDYINPELIPRFEKEHHCKLVIDTFDSNESMLAKIKAGASGYDILVPSSYMVKILDKQGMLQPLDHSKIINLSHIDTEYLSETAFDKEMRVSVPYMFAATGFAYLEDRVENVVPSWKMFDRADLKGRMTLLNDQRETIGAALKTLGYSINTTNDAELEKAREVVIGWKKNIAKFESDQYDAGIASGEFVLVHGYSGDLFQAQEENEKVAIVIPEEGTSIACDDLVIPKDAPNPDLAHAFINFLCEPEIAAKNVGYIFYLAPNKDAYPLLDAEIRENPAIFLDRAVLGRSEMIDDLGAEGNAKYTRIWDQIRAATTE